MEHNNLQLTLIDHQIMNSYCKLIDGLADYLGKGYGNCPAYAGKL